MLLYICSSNLTKSYPQFGLVEIQAKLGKARIFNKSRTGILSVFFYLELFHQRRTTPLPLPFSYNLFSSPPLPFLPSHPSSVLLPYHFSPLIPYLPYCNSPPSPFISPLLLSFSQILLISVNLDSHRVQRMLFLSLNYLKIGNILKTRTPRPFQSIL